MNGGDNRWVGREQTKEGERKRFGDQIWRERERDLGIGLEKKEIIFFYLIIL